MLLRAATTRDSVVATKQDWSIPILITFVLWVLVLFDPHIWVASYGPEVLRRIPTFTYPLLLLAIVVKPTHWIWYPPFLLYAANAIVGIPFAENIGRSFDTVVKILLLYYILAIGSLMFVRDTQKTVLILHLFLWQFLWWGFHAGFVGLVPWHPDLGEEDAFGPMMVMGMGYSFFFAMATQHRALRLATFSLAGLCLVGVVSSFARGAVIAAVFVVAHVWLRSPRKSQTFITLVLGLGIFLLAANWLFPSGEFWEEMSTITEGVEEGTSRDRWILWKMAWRAFLEHPIFGVGADNFGVFASENLWSDSEVMALYRTPGHLWGRALHNIFFQVLSEFGLIGTIAFIWLLIDFWKRNTQLRSTTFISAWSLANHGRLDLRMVSFALEGAMLGYLVTGFFYNQLYVHWFYSLLTANALLHTNASRALPRSIQHPDK